MIENPTPFVVVGGKENRPGQFTAVAVVCVLFALFALFTLTQSQPVQAQTPVKTPPLGVAVMSSPTDPLLGNRLAQAAGMALKYAAVNLSWSAVQPVTPTANCGNCQWGAYDALFPQMQAQGLIPVVLLGNNPTWASTNYGGTIDLPGGMDALASFVAATAQRYPNIRYFGFYSEPDGWNPLSPHYGWGGHGAEYAAMLKKVYPALKAANPNAQVVIGGVAYETYPGCFNFPKQECFDMQFVGDVLKAGGGPYFDVMDYHFYDNPTFTANYTPPNIVGKAIKLQQNFPGIIGKPFLLTEMGRPYAKSGETGYSHDETANAIVKLYSQLMAGAQYNLTYIASTWFVLEHVQECPGNNCTNQTIEWGLLDFQDVPWPIESSTLRTLAQEIGASSYLEPITGLGNLEGYIFGTVAKPNAVVWSTDPQGAASPYQVHASRLRVRTKTGQISIIVDGRTGDLDPRPGWVGLSVPTSPLYVSWGLGDYLPFLCNQCDAQSNSFHGVGLFLARLLCGGCSSGR